MGPDLRKHRWGGVDSNHRPTDYESAQAQLADLRKRFNLASDVRLRLLGLAHPFSRLLDVLRPVCGLIPSSPSCGFKRPHQ
jgi:hypothetical protein